MSISELIDSGAPEGPSPQLHSGTVRVRGGEVYAVLPTYSPDHDWGPLAGSTSGLAEGDEIGVAFGDDGTPWVVARPALADVSLAVPPGVMFEWPTATAPAGYLLCDGRSLLRADYPALFAVLGTTYGAADGTHFNLPDHRGRVSVTLDNLGGSDAGRLSAANTIGGTGGAETVTLTAQQIPAHSHGDGTLAVASHSHSDGTLAVASHSHDDGTLAAASHSHDDGTLAVASHSHDDGSLATASLIQPRVGGLIANNYNGYAYIPGYYAVDGWDTGATRDVTGSTGSASPDVSGSTGSASPDVSGSTGSASPDVTGSTGSASPDVTGSTGDAGGGLEHTNMPPYILLAKIIKT